MKLKRPITAFNPAKLFLLAFLLLTIFSKSYSQSNKGKVFWIAELPNSSVVTADFAIILANSGSTPANVTIKKPDGSGGYSLVASRSLAGGGLETFLIPTVNPTISRPRNPDNSITPSTATYYLNVYLVESDVNIVAFSFSPLVNVQTNDAALILPTHALGRKYFVGSYVHSILAAAQCSQVGVVASRPGITNVKVYDRNSNLIDDVNLNQGQYFQRLNGNLPANDMTGYSVIASQPVAVWSGNQNTAVGVSGSASDHLNEQLLPVETLSKNYIAAPSSQRPVGCTTNCANDIFRYVATEDGTSIVTTPNVGGTTVPLLKGQYIELSTNVPHVVTGDKPFYAYQYLVSQNNAGPAGQRIGDPDLLALPVVQQFQYDYVFLVPTTYLYNFVNIVAPVGTNVYVDGALIPSSSITWRTAGTVGGVTYAVGNYRLLATGRHTIVADKKIAITVSGFDVFAGYAYLGGSGLEPINAGCITGGPYLKLDCLNRETAVQLNGTPSCEGGGTPVITWTSPDGVVFSNPSIANPIATVPGWGTYEVTMVVNCSGNITVCTSEIIVREPAAGCANTPISITPPPDMIVPSDPGENYASGLNIGVATYVADQPAVLTNDGLAQYPLGETIVTWTVNDPYGRSANGTHKITVVPPPTIVPPAMIIVSTDPGETYATLNELHGSGYWQSPSTFWVYDDFSTPSASGTPAGNQYSEGDHTITWSVIDQWGRTATGTQIIRVVPPPPSITPPPMIVVPTDPGQGYATVTSLHGSSYWQSGSTYFVYNNYSVPSVSGTPAGDQYSSGDHTVTWSVTDQFGRTASGTQVVRVVPPPSIVPPAMIIVPTDPGQGYATVNDLHGSGYWQSPSTYWVYNNFSSPSASGVPSNNQYNAGDNTITWSVVDEFGRTASGTQVVRVVPPPTIVPPAMIIVPTDAGQGYATVNELHGSGYWQSPSTYWVYNNFSSPSASGVPSSNQYNVGDNTITWSVTDEFGRTASGTQVVRVVPPPSIVPPAMILVPTDAGQNYATVNELHGSGYWQSPSTYWVYNNFSTPGASGVPAGNQYNVGDNTVTWSVADQWGRTASGTQVVRVVPPPTIVAPPTINVQNDNGLPYATVNSLHGPGYWQSPSTYWVYNNFSTPSVTGVPAANHYPLGTTTVTWSVVDQWGRTATGTQSINVSSPPPTIVPPPAITVTAPYGQGYAVIPNIGTATYTVSVNPAVLTNTGTSNNQYPVGTTTITWTVTDGIGRSISGTQQITVLESQACPPVTVSITPSNDACGIKLTANGGGSYQWSFGGNTVSSAAQVVLGSNSAAGVYTVKVTNSCGNTATATYNYAGGAGSTVTGYTIIGLKSVKLGEKNDIDNGGVGVTSSTGTAAFRKNSSVDGEVRAKYISIQNPVSISSKVYSKAVVTLPTMQYFSGNCNNYSDYTVNSNVTVTLNSNYRNVYVKKGANVTLGGSVFKSVTLEEGATVKFTATTINIESLIIGKGLSTGVATVKFANNTSVRVSTQVKVEERNMVNPDNVTVWFYLGDSNCDEEKFMVKGNGSKVNANVYMPNGTLYVQSDCGHGYGCNHGYYSSGYSSGNCATTYMKGKFIAEEVESGDNVSWIGTGSGASCNTLNVSDNADPVINCPSAQQFCKSSNGTYSVPAATASDNSGVVSISYSMSGATNRSGSGADASGSFGVGTTTITWTAEDVNGNESSCTSTVKVTSGPDANISSSISDVFCGEITLSATCGTSGASYKWLYNNAVVGVGSSLSLGNGDAEGVYTLSVTSNGCTNANADTYTFTLQNQLSKYTIVGIKKVALGESNNVQTGSVGVMSYCGTASFRKNSSVAGPGAFVKAKDIDILSSPVTIPNKVYSAAVVTLPQMQYFSGNCNNYSNYTVAQNATVSLNNNYNCLTINKNATVTLNGSIFRKIVIGEGAKVTFTSTTLNIEELYVNNGPSNGYTKVNFANNTNVRVSKLVKIEENSQINAAGNRVTFYVGSNYSSCGDDASFLVYASRTTVNANVYVPEGDIKVVGGTYSNCNVSYGPGYMNGIFIAESVISEGRNIYWNSFSCSSARSPLASALGTGKAPEVIEGFKVIAAPNPSTNYFTLQLKSTNTNLVNIRVIDLSGRLVEVITNQEPTTVFRMGEKWMNGVYMVEVMQGSEKQTIRLVKAN